MLNDFFTGDILSLNSFTGKQKQKQIKSWWEIKTPQTATIKTVYSDFIYITSFQQTRVLIHCELPDVLTLKCWKRLEGSVLAPSTTVSWGGSDGGRTNRLQLSSLCLRKNKYLCLWRVVHVEVWAPTATNFTSDKDH